MTARRWSIIRLRDTQNYFFSFCEKNMIIFARLKKLYDSRQKERRHKKKKLKPGAISWFFDSDNGVNPNPAAQAKVDV